MDGELTFLYVPGEQIGYGRAGVYLAAELARRGITIFNDDGALTDTEGADARIALHGHAPPDGTATNAVCWVSVPTHANSWWDNQFTAILTMWEAMKLPESFRETLHEFDLVMVPSYQNVELFSKFHDNVKYLPLGVDPLIWRYHKPPDPHTTFNFMISGRGSRKGCDLAYEAFQTVFGKWWQFADSGAEYVGPRGKPAPELIMKSMRGHGEYYGPGVRHVTGRLSASAEVDLYKSAHCYIQPSRGEGFGLQPLQAMALGLPTILTAAHGHESFAPLGVGISAKPTTADYFIFGDAGEWWEPNFDELCEAMWDVYENYTHHVDRAKVSAATIAKDWTWERTADTFIAHMGDELTKPYTGSMTRVTPTPRLFKIVTTVDHLSNAAGVSRYFERGKVYYDIADIKRILYDAGILDPTCLEGDDLGLAPQQIDGLDEYKASRSYCPTCGEQLNTRPTYADALYAEMES